MRKASVLAVLIAVLLWPRPVSASFWGWLEQMSGPGPFDGHDYSLTPLCDRAPDAAGEGGGWGGGRWWRNCGKPFDLKAKATAAETAHPIVATVVVKVGMFTSKENDPRFKDRPVTEPDNIGQVRVTPVSAFYMRRSGPVDFGAGAGIWKVSAASGWDFSSFHKFTITPVALSISPLALCAKWKNTKIGNVQRVVRFEFEGTYVPGGFNGAEFGNMHTNFTVDHEFLIRRSLIVDLGALLWPQK